MSEVLFIVPRDTDDTGARWAYIQSCPHGSDMGAIRFAPTLRDERVPTEDPMRQWDKLAWEWHDLGGGLCSINPSILAKGVHDGQDCHFGPGTFKFVWLEPGQLRNPDTGLPDPNLWMEGYGPTSRTMPEPETPETPAPPATTEPAAPETPENPPAAAPAPPVCDDCGNLEAFGAHVEKPATGSQFLGYQMHRFRAKA